MLFISNINWQLDSNMCYKAEYTLKSFWNTKKGMNDGYWVCGKPSKEVIFEIVLEEMTFSIPPFSLKLSYHSTPSTLHLCFSCSPLHGFLDPPEWLQIIPDAFITHLHMLHYIIIWLLILICLITLTSLKTKGRGFVNLCSNSMWNNVCTSTKKYGQIN